MVGSMGSEYLNDGTNIFVYPTADQSLTAGSYHTVQYDTVEADRLGEFDTGSHTFTPENTAEYLISGTASWQVGLSGDTLRIRLYDVDNASTVHAWGFDAPSGNPVHLPYGIKTELTEGTSYRMEVHNGDSSDQTVSSKQYFPLSIREVSRS